MDERKNRTSIRKIYILIKFEAFEWKRKTGSCYAVWFSSLKLCRFFGKKIRGLVSKEKTKLVNSMFFTTKIKISFFFKNWKDLYVRAKSRYTLVFLPVLNLEIQIFIKVKILFLKWEKIYSSYEIDLQYNFHFQFYYLNLSFA